MARTGLPLAQYVNYIKLQLGDPILWVELEDMIPNIVEMAFQELKGYISDTETMTLPYSNVIDLTDKDVSSIVYIMRGRQNMSVGGFQDLMLVYTARNSMGNGINNTFTLDDYARALLVQQNKAALSTDLDFYHDKKNEKLYVYATQLLPESITIVYVPEYHDVSEIIEPYWQNYLKRLALAMTKETLGRIRGKYQLNSATYNLDADQLLSEAQNELSEIRTYLNNNKDFLLPMD